MSCSVSHSARSSREATVESPLDVTPLPPDTLDVAGMTWWNGLSEGDRRYWCLAARTAVPAHAWKYFRLVTAPRKLVKKVSEDD